MILVHWWVFKCRFLFMLLAIFKQINSYLQPTLIFSNLQSTFQVHEISVFNEAWVEVTSNIAFISNSFNQINEIFAILFQFKSFNAYIRHKSIQVSLFSASGLFHRVGKKRGWTRKRKKDDKNVMVSKIDYVMRAQLFCSV